ncbi:MAG: DUF3368 domain-containing protein [Saccharospirillaceae bacterium]|nr:DUF3368 domain-containing protein [Pseudomonadales bacterium]NRB81622.1 DUF3368 domain-containing protein [Saccharospirillaceae bacterium]
MSSDNSNQSNPKQPNQDRSNPKQTNTIIADTGPLIALALTQTLSLTCEILGNVIVPNTVYLEAMADLSRPGAKRILKSFEMKHFKVEQVSIDEKDQLMVNVLDQGEAEAIVLAKRNKSPVLMDERLGRKVAKQAGLSVIGTCGVFIALKKKGKIKAVAPLIDVLTNAGYRLSDNLIKQVKLMVGE